MSLVEPIYKRPPIRNVHHRRFVVEIGRAVGCMVCGHPDVQAAHLPIGPRGMGMKTGDDQIVGLCAPRPGEPGCHARHDAAKLSFWVDLKFHEMIEGFAYQLYQNTGNHAEGERLVKMARAQIAARRFNK